MATTRRPETRRLSDAELTTVMELLKGSDSVELKLTIDQAEQGATIRGLPIDPVEAQPRQVFFFDTADLALNRAGLVVRARRIQGGAGDTVVKLRPIEPESIPDVLRRNPAFKVELDLIPGGFVCSASFKGKSSGDEIREATRGELPIRKLFSKEQRLFYEDNAPAGIELDALLALGPTFLLKAQFDAEELGRKVVAELWLYPDGSRVLELSTKCQPKETFQVAAEARAYLVSRGVDLGGIQQTKTKSALEYFKRRLAAEATVSTQAAT
jgi:hypothetical protein